MEEAAVAHVPGAGQALKRCLCSGADEWLACPVTIAISDSMTRAVLMHCASGRDGQLFQLQ